MRLLDLYCGAGGCSAGYVAAGFDVVGVDVNPQPHYPYRFVQSDALDYLRDHGDGFDVIHASPPCQAHTRAGHLRAAQGRASKYPDLLTPTIAALRAQARPWVVENVPGAPFPGLFTTQLCGSSFGLGVQRHRLFASPLLLFGTECDHKRQGRPVGVYYRTGEIIPNGGRTARTLAEGQAAMGGVGWMTWNELKESIPPAFTEHIGAQLLTHLEPRPEPVQVGT